MRLTLHTDYALRTLIYLALKNGPATIAEIAERYRISENHLMKVVQRLGREGFIKTVRGRGGGILLTKEPETIRVGDVVRKTEDSLALVECFDLKSNTCPIAGLCGLQRCLGEALAAYLAVLDRYTLADISHGGRKLNRVLGLPSHAIGN